MPDRYKEAILEHLAGREYTPVKPRQLARRLNVSEEQYGTFREAVKQLRDSGRIVKGSKNALTLPEMGDRVVGHFRSNPKGFGFVIPEEPNAHGDLFIPPGNGADAMNGDLVEARTYKRGKRGGETAYAGEIVKIVKRGENRYVGTLDQAGEQWFVRPDGKHMTTPIIVRDVAGDGPGTDTKVVVEIVQYPTDGNWPVGVIVEVLGRQTELQAEQLAVIRAHDIRDQWPEEALEEARRVVRAFDPEADADGREDLTATTTVTIDPVDARDFDDAISIETEPDGHRVLGVHIADVSHFVQPGGPLDAEALERGTSVYLVKKVVPMLPEILSNGVCSLQQGQKRFCKSAFIRYNSDGEIVGTRFAQTVIQSDRRLTYEEAQGILAGKTGGFADPIVQLVGQMEALARKIEARREKAGMLHLDLPEVELVLSDEDKVVDAVPEDESYTHTIIEMFMVEANDAVATMLDRHDVPFLRRIHPDPDVDGTVKLGAFTRACGHTLPKQLDRHALQNLLDNVKGRPESYAVNLAVLKTFQQAEYSPMRVGHFALASPQYCHFTSPIRRYPDLTIHRLLADHADGRLEEHQDDDVGELTELGEHCTNTEKQAEAAERDLRDVLVLQYLETKIGEDFEGVITGVTNFGIFVQSPRFLVEGLIRLEDLGDDWWEVQAREGLIVGEVSGRKWRIGDRIHVRIAGVDVAMRQLNLVPAEKPKDKKTREKPKKKKGQDRKAQSGKRSKPQTRSGSKSRSSDRRTAKGKTKAKAKGKGGKKYSSDRRKRKGSGKGPGKGRSRRKRKGRR
jgi:ribonuclease R